MAHPDDVDVNLVGRCLLEPVVHPKTGEDLKDAGDYLGDESDLLALLDAGVESVVVRTVMTCHSKHGICQACYGWDLATRMPVDIGTAVGIIAAQSIGEPGTQLTMRTFHTGGVAGEDITHGLPRVTELFEARKPKGQAILAEISGKLTIDDTEKTRQLIVKDEDGQEKSYAVSRRARLRPGIADGVEVSVGQQLTEGSVNPHDLLHLRGPSDVLRYVVTQVQDVYRSQGVDINDKHIEVIARQMLRKVTVLEPGDTDFLPGQLVSRIAFEQENETLMADGAEPGVGAPVLLGITKASLATESYLSAASFQETTRVLTDAAIAGKADQLLGLKENVIIGKLIPAATGMKRYRSVKLTYKGQSAEWDQAEDGPLPEFAPEELKELESLLPAPALDEAAMAADDAAAFFADLESRKEADIDADVASFADKVFEPEVAAIKPDDDGVVSVEEAVPHDALAGEVTSMPLGELGISTRWVTKLAEAGIATVGDALKLTHADLLAVPGIGEKAIQELEDRLAEHGATISV